MVSSSESESDCSRSTEESMPRNSPVSSGGKGKKPKTQKKVIPTPKPQETGPEPEEMEPGMVISNDQIANTIHVLDSIRFNGFNAAFLRNKITSIERNSAMLCDDLLFMITLCIARGTNLEKITRTLAADTKTKLVGLIEKYNLKSQVRDKVEDITLGRVCACFPAETCVTVSRVEEKGRTIPASRLPMGMPPFMQTACFPSLIPKDLGPIADALKVLHMSWSLRFDRVVNDHPTPLERLSQYQDAAFNSQVLNNEARRAILIKHGILMKGSKGPELPDSIFYACCVAAQMRKLDIPDFPDQTLISIVESTYNSGIKLKVDETEDVDDAPMVS